MFHVFNTVDEVSCAPSLLFRADISWGVQNANALSNNRIQTYLYKKLDEVEEDEGRTLELTNSDQMLLQFGYIYSTLLLVVKMVPMTKKE